MLDAVFVFRRSYDTDYVKLHLLPVIVVSDKAVGSTAYVAYLFRGDGLHRVKRAFPSCLYFHKYNPVVFESDDVDFEKAFAGIIVNDCVTFGDQIFPGYPFSPCSEVVVVCHKLFLED